jgi:hypothetical protein
MMSRYAIWTDALTRSYTGERFGVKLGAAFADVIKWLRVMRPYRGREDGANSDFFHAVYAITHVVYTLNDYSKYKLRPDLLAQEFEFLKGNLKEAIATEDPEMMGEFLDTLRAFGLDDTDLLIQKGMDYLLFRQNANGSWGEENVEEVYRRYHPTWTAIDGLRGYKWATRRLSFPNLEPMLRRFAISE